MVDAVNEVRWRRFVQRDKARARASGFMSVKCSFVVIDRALQTNWMSLLIHAGLCIFRLFKQLMGLIRQGYLLPCARNVAVED